MSLSLKTIGAPIRRLATGASLALMAACTGGTETKPKVTVSCSATPSAVIEGQSINYSCSATPSGGGSVSSFQVLYNGAPINTGAGMAISGSYAPVGSGNLSANTQGNPDATSNNVPVTVNPLTLQNGNLLTFEDSTGATNLATLANAPGGTFGVGAPSDNRFSAILIGNELRSQGQPNANGTFTVPINYTLNGVTKNAVVNVNHQAMTDFEYELREARSDSLIMTPATIQIGGVTYAAVNGTIRGQVTPGQKTVRLVTNAETFKSDRVQNADGSPAGINWQGNDLITVNYSADFPNAAKIIRLAKQGSPYGSFDEMMRIYEAVWAPAPDNSHITPVFPIARIRIYNGPADATWGCVRAPTAAELDTITQGALDTKVHFQTPDYQIVIDTIAAMPSATPQIIPEGTQVVCIGDVSSNATIRYLNGSVRGSRARLLPGFGTTTAMSELTNMHAGQKAEDLLNGNTFFAKNRPNGIVDLVPGDVDIIQNVNNTFARDAEKKRLANNNTPYILRP